MNFRHFAVLIAISTLSFSCGGSGGDSSGDAQTGSATPQPAATTKSPGGDKGIGPIDKLDVASLDVALAPKGEEIFTTKCSACHKIEERYIGPALTGVTTRRKPEWIMNMILNPDVMVKEDETAKGLLAEYLAPMTNQNLSHEEAEAILVYFLENDK